MSSSTIEKTSMAERLKRRAVTVKDEFNSIWKIINSKLSIEKEAYPNYFNQLFQIPGPKNMLDPTFFDIYDEKAGFEISVDQIHNNKLSSPIYIIISPNAKISENPNANKNVFVFYKLNFESSQISPELIDKILAIEGINILTFHTLYLNLYGSKIEHDDLTISAIGWSCIPLIKEFNHDIFVTSGVYMVLIISYPFFNFH